ncbi:hypothetical protein HXA34_19080 [Salipaludibacillus agaradhaerens]|jgi:hypothetical protein|uniref:Uncharacterized protein n=1 Tax=Salipaludibacillus agaradhaerens TaxID=76935 RepID=A0A9Q4G170_SALAG|nr:hypothetical protein [Salipaludibacillus agaradhaerens]UJW59437.1 hypothetical protein HXZ66_19500 [Bacillus sp. A116_S68]MCR6098732.1 hypothetical protein [Salipaludibacillus agaradhaerens]MCR6108407.1 hypothetical protein [Salipaludibacillus agaradhaerens]MCR6115739.1 hypothetical protein [Salipaludibacillus agaradhaerens]MCR6120430.1 hypothetical protein [Salipaludibacillus agaradhaerens]
MDFFFYIAVIVGMYYLYEAYNSKKKYKIKERELRVEEKRIELEKLRLEKGLSSSETQEVEATKEER